MTRFTNAGEVRSHVAVDGYGTIYNPALVQGQLQFGAKVASQFWKGALTSMNETGSVSMDVLVRLRTAILDGVYAPNTRLRFAGLQNEYQAGVGTLREVLFHMLSEGFVTLDAGKGFRVAPVSLDDLHDITEMRVTLEKRAVREAIQNGDDLWEAGVVSKFHLLSKMEKVPITERLNEPTAWTNIHRDFHRELINPCSSKWLLRFHRILFDQAHRYRMLALRHRPPGRSTRTGEHRALMEAMLARDVEAATSLAERHIRRTVEDVEQHAPQVTRDVQKAKTTRAGVVPP